MSCSVYRGLGFPRWRSAIAARRSSRSWPRRKPGFGSWSAFRKNLRCYSCRADRGCNSPWRRSTCWGLAILAAISCLALGARWRPKNVHESPRHKLPGTVRALISAACHPPRICPAIQPFAIPICIIVRTKQFRESSLICVRKARCPWYAMRPVISCRGRSI